MKGEKMKNVRVKVWESCSGDLWEYHIYENRKRLMSLSSNTRQTYWTRKSAVIRNAKVMAKRIGIKYDPEIVKQHGC